MNFGPSIFSPQPICLPVKTRTPEAWREREGPPRMLRINPHFTPPSLCLSALDSVSRCTASPAFFIAQILLSLLARKLSYAVMVIRLRDCLSYLKIHQASTPECLSLTFSRDDVLVAVLWRDEWACLIWIADKIALLCSNEPLHFALAKSLSSRNRLEPRLHANSGWQSCLGSLLIARVGQQTILSDIPLATVDCGFHL